MAKNTGVGEGHRNGGFVDDPKEVASYVATLTTELTELARSARLPALDYFLDMARYEALSIAGRDPTEQQRPPGSLS
jgi:hypothetical protein